MTSLEENQVISNNTRSKKKQTVEENQISNNTRSKKNDVLVDYTAIDNIRSNKKRSKLDDDENNEDDSIMDEDKIKFLELFKNIKSIENWELDYNDEEVEYLKKLDIEKRTELLLSEKKILDNNNQKIPIRFRILENKEMNERTKYIILKKLSSLEDLDEEEYSKQLNWIENLNMVPFGVYNDLPIKLSDGYPKVGSYMKDVCQILNKSIYGHQSSKVQILEYIAQYITNPQSNGKCLALQGPPGNGKTTLIRNGFSKALNRPFIQISLGGMNDVNILNGHDATYVGAKCGRIIQALQDTGTMAPIIYFDELDKVGEGHKGNDIYNFLCHLIDFSQNMDFHDNFFSDISFDLSKAIFIFSFNDVSNINPILLDRLHIIETNGFNTNDKVKIARDYIINQSLKEVGLEESDIVFTDDVLNHIATMFSLEPGVRKFKQCLETIILRINMLKLTGLDSSALDLPYKIDNLSFPFTPNIKNIDNLLSGYSQKDSGYLTMYT